MIIKLPVFDNAQKSNLFSKFASSNDVTLPLLMKNVTLPFDVNMKAVSEPTENDSEMDSEEVAEIYAAANKEKYANDEEYSDEDERRHRA